MHAALVRLTVDPDQAPAAAEALTNDILPRVRSAPGFVAGYWLEPADGHGFSMVLFETEEQARETAPPVSSWAAPGIVISGSSFGESRRPPERVGLAAVTPSRVVSGPAEVAPADDGAAAAHEGFVQAGEPFPAQT